MVRAGYLLLIYHKILALGRNFIDHIRRSFVILCVGGKISFPDCDFRFSSSASFVCVTGEREAGGWGRSTKFPSCCCQPKPLGIMKGRHHRKPCWVGKYSLSYIKQDSIWPAPPGAGNSCCGERKPPTLLLGQTRRSSGSTRILSTGAARFFQACPLCPR